MIKILIVCLVLVGATQAQPEPQPTEATLGQPFELAPGASAVVVESGLHLLLNAVVQDSRCPADVNCVWAGEVSVEIEALAPNQAPETFVLSTCCGQSSYVYAGHLVSVDDVTPAARKAGEGIEQSEYRATLVVNDEANFVDATRTALFVTREREL